MPETRLGLKTGVTGKHRLNIVMPGLVQGIHVFGPAKKDVDGRVKPGHDG
jgi:hypothetical protein